jgi:hypothetical protein
LKYPEGRGIVMQKLSVREKAGILANFRQKCEYFKACLREFWKLDVKPTDRLEGVSTELPWHGHSWQSAAPNHTRAYAKHKLKITRFADFMNRDTRRPFTVRDWRRFVEGAGRRKHGIDPSNVIVIDRANEKKFIEYRST